MPVKGLAAFLLLFLVLASPGLSEENQEEIPSEELLEFLGSWEANDGEWLDPIELQEEIVEEKEKERNG